jgi:hypothetical protein
MDHLKSKTIISRALILLPFILILILGQCTYYNEQDLYPPGSEICDSTSFTFSGAVFPIIKSNCINCHSGSAPVSGLVLEDYISISAAALTPAGEFGSLYGAITHHSGNSAMPKNNTKLSDCKIFQIKEWIDAGAPND